MDKINMVALARDLALEKHKDEIVTTYGGLKRPRVLHLQDVASLVWVCGGGEDEISSAWLHDIVEDTDVSISDLKNIFGERVASLVRELTDSKEYKDMPLLERKQLQAERISKASTSAKKVKLADQISNINFLPVDPDVSMAEQEIRDYIKNTKFIADACRGVTPMLDELYERTYRACVEKYDF